MKTTAVRLYGAMDLRTETFELPDIDDNGVRVCGVFGNLDRARPTARGCRRKPERLWFTPRPMRG